jgi:hypothetical protein
MVWAQYPPQTQEKQVVRDDDTVSDYSVETLLTNYDDPATTAALSWRMDPRDSFSDWRIDIRVCHNGCSTVDSYHVHRTALSFGQRRSGYFSNLFHCGDGPVTQIDLSDKAAAYFPDFLDYIYGSRAFYFTTSNAVALCFLAQCFLVVALQQEVDAFIREDIRLNNVGTYLSDAIHFKDEAVSNRVMDKCVEEAFQVCTSTQFSKALPSPLSTASQAEVWMFFTRFPNVVVQRVQKSSIFKKKK